MKKSILILLLALTLTFVLVGCNNNQEGGENNGVPYSYTIEIKTDTGKLLSGVVAELFDANGEFIDYKSSNDQGKIIFENLDKEAKSVVISDVPKGYKLEQNYTLGGQNTEILLETQLINEGHQGVKYQLGSIMHDFTVTDQNGNEITLSQLLEEKQMVMLNFWYVTCSFCVKEFPDMNKVYDAYSNKAGFVGLNSSNNQTSINSFIANFDERFNYYNGTETNPIDVPDLTLPLAVDNQGIENAFGFSVNPATVVIDKYGVVSFIHEGALSEDQLESLFSFFTDEDYTHKEINSISQIPQNN